MAVLLVWWRLPESRRSFQVAFLRCLARNQAYGEVGFAALVFEEVERIASEQRWASYGFVTSSSSRVTQGTFTGIDRVFVQPKLSKMP